MEETIKLNLGCDDVLREEGWQNIDLFRKKTGVIRMDARTLNYSANSVSEIWAKHIIEHIEWDDIINTLKEWYRVLKPEGKLAIITPDFSLLWTEVEKLERCDKSETIYGTIFNLLYGDQQREGSFHKSIFTRKLLEGTLRDIGFKDIVFSGADRPFVMKITCIK